MIQFNLLPDVKLQYIKTQRTKRVVMISSLAAAGFALSVLVILFASVQFAQKKHMDDISKNITTEVKKLNSVEDLNKILTIQSQLNSLTSLHQDKPLTSRLFGYVQQVTPTLANIGKLDVDFLAGTINLQGTADSVVTANKFADNVKFATFKDATSDTTKPFTNVVTTLSSDNRGAVFTLSFNFDPILFSSTETPVLVVPKIISTRSETEKPSAVFKEQPAKKTEVTP